jgi:hypothetical protein
MHFVMPLILAVVVGLLGGLTVASSTGPRV